jgi:hypothetical protein
MASSKKRERQKRVIERLKAQLVTGKKHKTNITDLTDGDKTRIKKEIQILESKF